MQRPTNIANVIDRYTLGQKYDAEIKVALSDKQLLAWILKYSVEELKDYSIEEIKECIEDAPEVGSHPVVPESKKEKIDGMNTEDNVPGEGKVTYDIRFRICLRGGDRIGMIINVEAQNKYNPGYNLVTRGIYYCARLLSSQVGDEFSTMEYEKLQKVYSIWICVNVPQNAEHTITRYKMHRVDIHGHADGNPRYDLMELVMIHLGRGSTVEKGTKIHGLLHTILSTKLSPAEKKEILNREYDIAVSKELEGGMIQMCNLSEAIEEKALERGLEQGLEQGTIRTLLALVKDGDITLEVAAKKAGMTIEEFKEKATKLEK